MWNIAVLVVGLVAIAAVSEAKADTASLERIDLAQARPLVSGERVRVKKLSRDIESAMQTLNKGGVAPFQAPAYVKKWQRVIERYRVTLEKYPQVDDLDVKVAAAKLAELKNMVAFGMREAGKQQSKLGDVQKILATIEKNLRGNRAPQWLPAPFDAKEARAWARSAATAKRTAQGSIAEIQRIAPTAHLPINRGTVQQGAPYDKQDLSRLLNFANGIVRDVDTAVQKTVSTLKFQEKEQNKTLDYYRSLDPKNESHRMNAFLREGAEAEIYGSLDKELAFAKSVIAYQQALGHKPTAGSLARVDEIVALRKAYAKNRATALGESKLPNPKSADAERIAIATQILAKPRYKFGEHGPIVLTTKNVVEREKQVSRAEIKDVDVRLSGSIILSGTETTWHYKWKEFKFAAPIKEANSDDWYVWWITAKKFSSGGARTPIGAWVSGAATKGDRILKKNF
jgi:hypothetical protein